MAITAADVKALRDTTGAGMMDAKKALTEADGDFDAAKQLLLEKGLIKAAGRSDRENNQGAIAMASSGQAAAFVQLKCETDFSAKADDFTELVQSLADAVLADGEGAIDGFAEKIDALKLSKKENVEVGKVAHFQAADGNVLDSYLHTQDGRGINAVLVEASGVDAELAHEISLHIAFAKPAGLAREEISDEEVDKARKSLEDLTRSEGKPEPAIAKIVEGRLGKWYGERVLLEQGMFGEKETVQDRIGDGSIVRFAQAVVG